MKKIFITADSFGLCDFIREKSFKRCILKNRNKDHHTCLIKEQNRKLPEIYN